MTRLRKMMLEELQRRNYAQNTARIYIKVVEKFAQYFGRSPERLGPNQIRGYQAHLFRDCHLSPGTVEQAVAALRFFYVKTLKRRYMRLTGVIPGSGLQARIKGRAAFHHLVGQERLAGKLDRGNAHRD